MTRAPGHVQLAVIRALQDGLGVEDVAASGAATIDQARGVVAEIQKLGLMAPIVAEARERAARDRAGAEVAP